MNIDYILIYQVKPLLEVTNNDEKLKEKEDELKKVNDRYVSAETDLKELNIRHAQMLEDKNVLQDQLQAETDLCTEAEEVCIIKFIIRKFIHRKFIAIQKYLNIYLLIILL